jgi:hypothetical protein
MSKMDDHMDHMDQMFRIGSNNPAITVPAVQIYDQSRRQRKPQNGEGVDVSDPAGDQAKVAQDKDFVSGQRLTKYDVGWRRMVRNFSPSYRTLYLPAVFFNDSIVGGSPSPWGLASSVSFSSRFHIRPAGSTGSLSFSSS